MYHLFFSQVISYSERRRHRDAHRFEKISNIIKQFKLSCSKMAASFQSMEVRNQSFAAFIDVFTTNTYIMVILSDPTIRESKINHPKSMREKYASLSIVWATCDF
jgi:hypothetical protein